ncbi:type VI secretion system Vgr family protein [Jannaschia aquimarina]|uniref:Phage-related baseplate assembly protein n=1 Tax=Jannaschia aquimarina TaxID=935700 RepID=A0A0D1CL92_9RHOB|nr:type VI secretion system tip protein TssI/VgrG [Jannaschia aquimarina]KIT15577.1 Phage-related baseplate assembly protein [Jannaschia aquimarina]SNT27188.1 type VI secretion system secreted protein VgrG [Jannaschia aquimarina]
MNALFSQDARQGRLTTTLGKDALVLLRMDGTEELSGDFEWRVEALSTRGDVDLHALLGTPATVEVDLAGGTRHFDGVVCEARHAGVSENGFRYDLVLRPWLHVAGLRRNMRIFHNKTVVQIVEEVLSAYADLGEPHLEVALTEDYPVLEYTVQYGESDADFVRRQLERFGITWSWVHGDGTHAMRLTDLPESHALVPGGDRPYYGVEGHHLAEEEHFRTWSSAERITTGAVRLTEYNFKTPRAMQEVDRMGDASHPHGQVESYDWPGDYLDQGGGRGVVARRAQGERGQAPRHRATGFVASLGAGGRVTLAGDRVENATGRTFLCLRAEHRFRSQAYGTGDAQADEVPYEGSYVLMPDDAPLVPERRTPGPKVQGPETAVVVGEGEIDCDEHGRILARFHWDDTGAHTMRMRVSQNWASKGWGGMVIPRIGMEVIVEHLRGDPDKPIVTGCVFNGVNYAPYALPANKTKSVFRSDTHKGRGFNELTFEDDRGREEVYLHAQKDQTIHVENNRAKRIDVNQFESVGHNKAIEVGNNHEEVVGGNVHMVIGANRLAGFVSKVHSHFGNALMDKAGKILKSANLMGALGAAGLGKGNLTVHIGGNKAETTAVTSTETVGVNKATIVGGTRQDFTGGSYHSFSGQHRMDETLRTLTQVAGERWQAGSGKTHIVLDAASGKITIEADDIELKGHKSISMKAPRIDLN